MKFFLDEPNLNYSIMRCLSEGEQWELGIYPTFGGCRCAAGRTDQIFYAKGGYCCGMNGYLVQSVFLALLGILSCMPETSTIRNVEDMLPMWKRRPIDKDDCFLSLMLTAKRYMAADYTLNPTIAFELENVRDNLGIRHVLATAQARAKLLEEEIETI